MSKKRVIYDILELSLPVIAEMVIYTLMWLFDMMMIGRFGGNIIVSSVGLCDEILYTLLDIFIGVGISIGITSLIARKVGGNKWLEAEEYGSIGFTAGLIISIIISFLIFAFCRDILIFAGADSDVLPSAVIYMKLTIPGIFFNMMINTICALLRGYGNTKIPLYTSLIVCFWKLILDWILIFGNLNFNSMGIKGPAVATTISQFIGLFYVFSYTQKNSYIKIKLKYILSFSRQKLKELLLLSIPSAMEEAAFSISRLLSTFIIMHAGTVAFASNQIATTIESMSFMPGAGFGLAATTLVGFCVGEKNYKKAKKYAYGTTFLTTLMMLTCSIIFIIIPRMLVSVFINESEREVIHLATQCLIIAAFEQPVMAIAMVLGGSLKGYGDTKSPFVVSLISSWCIRLPLMFYFIYLLKYNVTYVWWITAFQWSFNAVLMYIFFKKRFKTFYRKLKFD